MERLTKAELAQEKQWSTTPEGHHSILLASIERLTPLACHFAKRGGICEPDDLISIGWIAMGKCIKRWVPQVGVPFWSYAKPFVKAAMVRAVKEAATPQPDTPIDPDTTPMPMEEDRLTLEGLTATQRAVIEMRLLQVPRASEQETRKALGLSLRELRKELWEALGILKAQHYPR